ncbi:regulator of sigma E protease [Neisseria sp. HSC-16F19]|nr:RIP metalloprotease RseP [Neisseria sp. HSC-16F19]MCP2039993.1 regulator of sigma E protease [Neisseria sp. HSC-16F19]
MLLTLLAFITAIVILVSLHELGHYLVARWCGVKVVRFSVGFGKPFWKKKRGDTEWCLAPIPLGGYVKMVDTREGNVAEADLPYAFDKQHPAKRIAIVAAGPLTNLVLAVLLYGASFSFGVTEIRPWVGTVEPASIASQAGFKSGDRIQSVNGAAVKDWGDAQTAIILQLNGGKVDVAVQTEEGGEAVRVIDVAGTPAAAAVAKHNGYIGMSPGKITRRIGDVAPDSPAAHAGLKAGDTLLAIDGEGVAQWHDLVAKISGSAGQKLEITYERDGQQHTVAVRPESRVAADGRIVGIIGVIPMADPEWARQVRHRYVPGIGEAFSLGAEKTAHYSWVTLRFFGKLVTGEASLRYVSGPVAIADVAGRTLRDGIQSYIEFLAFVSLSLGIMNLLPVPVLDGGHLLYYSIEWLRGRPLSERVQELGMRLGVFIMLTFMLVAFFNDITRLLG